MKSSSSPSPSSSHYHHHQMSGSCCNNNGAVSNYSQFTTPTKSSSYRSSSSLSPPPSTDVAGNAPVGKFSSSPTSGNHNNNTSCNNNSNLNYNNNHELAFCIVWSPLPIITWFLPFVGHTGICNSHGIASDFRGPYYVGDDGEMAFGAPTRALQIILPSAAVTTPTRQATTAIAIRSTPRRKQSTTASLVVDDNNRAEPNTADNDDDDHDDGGNVGNNSDDDDIELYDRETGTGQLNSHNASTISAQQWDEAIIEANEVYNHRMHNICCDNCHSHVAYALNLMNIHYYGIYKWDMIKIAVLMFFYGRFLSYMAILQQFGPFIIIIGFFVFISHLS